MLGLEGTLSVLLLLLMITQCMVMFICCTVSPKLLKYLNKFWTEIDKQVDKNIKALWSDRDGEYLSSDFNMYLLDNGSLC